MKTKVQMHSHLWELEYMQAIGKIKRKVLFALSDIIENNNT